MSEPRLCPQCAAEIPANSPAGLCPRCLLLAANDSQSAAASAEPGPTKITPPASGFVPPTPEELAPLFPQLEILELLGKGGMGAVYKARQPGLDRLVALKILPPEISHDPTFAERFQREARALARLSHPHIVAVYDFGTTEANGGRQPPGATNSQLNQGADAPRSPSLCYIVMEFVDGANLRQTIKAGKLAAAEALAIVPQICEALQFAHDEGIVHRDIKPENILIDKRGRVKIADFGLAKLMANGGCESPGESLTAAHQVMGTLRYMAPEQMQGSREVDHRADIYSLGVVFYELLTGELPMGKFAPPSKKVQVDVRLDEVVLRALEQDPEQRYQHASDVKVELDTISRSPLQQSMPRSEPAERVDSERPAPRLRRIFEGPIAWKAFLVSNSLLIGGIVVRAHLGRPGSSVWIVSDAAIWGFVLTAGILTLLLWGVIKTIASNGPREPAMRRFGHVGLGLFSLILAVPAIEKLPVVDGIIWYRQVFALSVPRDVKVRIPFAREPGAAEGPEGTIREPHFEYVSARMLYCRSGAVDLETEHPIPPGTYSQWGLTVTVSPEYVLDIRPTDNRRYGIPGPSKRLATGAYLTRCSLFGIQNDATAPSLRSREEDRWANEMFCMGLLVLTIVFLHRNWRPTRRLLGISETATVVVTPRTPPVLPIGSSEPRLSRCALVGAIWGGFGLPAAIILALAISTTPKGTTLGGILHIPVPLFALFAISAPIGATILSAVAIAKIKHSDGKLYGLRLAQADVLLFPLLLLGVVAMCAGTILLRGPLRSSGLDESIFWSPRQEVLMALIALPIWFFPARALWRAVVGPRDAFELGKIPLVSNEPLTGKAALVVALVAIAAHAWPWHFVIPPNTGFRVISNFDDMSALQSLWLLVLSIGAALFASVATLARPAQMILRGGSAIAALTALVIQVRFYRSLGEFEPGQVEKVVRLTRSYPQMGLYVTIAFTGLAILFFMLRIFDEPPLRRDTEESSRPLDPE